jgi:hypothetical protein
MLGIHSSFIDAVHRAVLVFGALQFITWRNTYVYLLTCVTRGHHNYKRTQHVELNEILSCLLYGTVQLSVGNPNSLAGPDKFEPVIAQHSH